MLTGVVRIGIGLTVGLLGGNIHIQLRQDYRLLALGLGVRGLVDLAEHLGDIRTSVGHLLLNISFTESILSAYGLHLFFYLFEDGGGGGRHAVEIFVFVEFLTQVLLYRLNEIVQISHVVKHFALSCLLVRLIQVFSFSIPSALTRSILFAA